MTAALLFPSVIGPGFASLPAVVQSVHVRAGLRRYEGEVDVQRGSGFVARLCAWATRLPPAECGPITVEIEAHPGRERWCRRIGGHAMHSRLWSDEGLLHERLGRVTFGFLLAVGDGAITWRVSSVRVLGIPLPAHWFAGVMAREFDHGGRYGFEVTARMPLAGLLVRYSGALDVE